MGVMKNLSLVAATVLVVALPKPAMAQEEAAGARTRVLSITPGIRIVDVGVDTNVFNESGRRDPDFTATVLPRLEAQVETHRFDLRASGSAGLVYYQKYTSERAVNPALDLKTERRFGSHLALYGEGRYGYSKERSGFEVDARIRRTGRHAVFGSRAGGRRMRVDMRVSDARIEYDDDAPFPGGEPASNLDRTTRAASAELGYRFTRYTWMIFGADTGFDRFPRSPHRDVNSTGGFAGVRLEPRAAIAGHARVGYRVADMLADGMPDFSGITARGGVSFTWRDTLALSAGGERDLDYSFEADRPYFVYDLYEVGVRHALGGRFDIGASASHTTLAYRWFDPAAVVGSADGERYGAQIRGAAVSLGLRLTRQSRVGIYVARWERLGERPYETTRTGVQVTLGRANVSERGVFLLGPGR
jgi:hypothetical protein